MPGESRGAKHAADKATNAQLRRHLEPVLAPSEPAFPRADSPGVGMGGCLVPVGGGREGMGE